MLTWACRNAHMKWQCGGNCCIQISSPCMVSTICMVINPECPLYHPGWRMGILCSTYNKPQTHIDIPWWGNWLLNYWWMSYPNQLGLRCCSGIGILTYNGTNHHTWWFERSEEFICHRDKSHWTILGQHTCNGVTHSLLDRFWLDRSQWLRTDIW